MKAIVLAGGFAKRLWPLTLNKAKPLLDMGGKPIINYTIEKLEKIDEIDEIFVSTNAKFEQVFEKWLEKYKFKKVKVVIEETHSEEEKLGAIGGINFVLEKEKIADDCLIIAGDNILGFDVADFLDFYNSKKSPVIALFDVNDIEKVLTFDKSRAQLAYQQSYSAIIFLIEKFGLDGLKKTITAMTTEENIDQAFLNSIGMDLWDFELEWMKHIKRKHRWHFLIDFEFYLWIFILGLFILVSILMRLRNRRTIQRWEDEEGTIEPW